MTKVLRRILKINRNSLIVLCWEKVEVTLLIKCSCGNSLYRYRIEVVIVTKD